jgi:hypothetical protein
MRGNDQIERLIYTTVHLTAGLIYGDLDVSLYIEVIPEFVLTMYDHDPENETDDELVDKFLAWVSLRVT